MQAVILAAGRSTRTYPLTSTRPKPLIPIWDRPLLEHQLGQLSGIIDEAVLVVGYRREQIEAHLGEEHRGIRLRYVEQKTQRGTADAVLAARPAVNERVLILNGDDFYHHDDLSALAEGGRGLLVTQAPDPQNRAVVTIADGVIADIVEKPADAAPGAWCSVGGYCMEANDLSMLDELTLSPRGELELPDLILKLVDAYSVRPQKIGKWWLPLTYAWDVLTAIRHIWSDDERADDLGVTARTHGLATEGPVWIGENVRVGAEVKLVGPTTIGSGTTIEDGAVVSRSAIFERAHVGSGARVADSVLGESVHIGRNAELVSAEGRELVIDIKGKVVSPELDRLGSILGDEARVDDGSRVEPGTLVPSASA